jgi:peptidoglycan/xylan/chitin deacetylase (PgdA/CDA1 family)
MSSATPLNKIAWVGRLTGPKGELAYRLLTEVVPRFQKIRSTCVGGRSTHRFTAATPANATLTGFVRDVIEVMRGSQLVIGGGRVPLEAMRLGVPVIAVGEACYVGPITADTIGQAKVTNFGDCAASRSPDLAPLIADLERLVGGGRLPIEHYASYLADYDAEGVYARVMEVYREARIDAQLGRFAELPVLVYHRVVAIPPRGSRFNVYITRDDLERQLDTLKRRGYQTITFRDLDHGVRVRRPVILTFDDGYADNHDNLLPLLQAHDAKAVVYVLGDRSLRTNAWDMAAGDPDVALMDDAQVRACHASGHIEIGSHGLRHRRLPQLDDEGLTAEIASSKRTLEDLIGNEVVSFAYPYGDYGDREVDAVRKAGYRFGVGTVNGPVRIGADRYRIRRIPIFPKTGGFGFWKKTSGYYLRYCRLKGKDF